MRCARDGGGSKRRPHSGAGEFVVAPFSSAMLENGSIATGHLPSYRSGAARAPERMRLDAAYHIPPGYPDVPTTVRTINAGAEDFLTKPVSSDQLLPAIDRAIFPTEKGRAGQQRATKEYRSRRSMMP